MFLPQTDYSEETQGHQESGTTPLSRMRLEGVVLPVDKWWISVEHFVAPLEIVLDTSSMARRGRALLRPAVEERLERSLNDHAVIWAELSRH